MKIIHIVENLDKGAVENWLVNVFMESRILKPDWEWTFYCILGKPGRLDEKVRQIGGNIIYAPCTVSNKIRFLQALRKTLKAGNYDIIHSHHDYLSGFYLTASCGIDFKKRILHIHNTDAALPVGNKLLHNALLKPFRWVGIYFSDIIVGISNDTLQQFLKKTKPGKKQVTVLYYGINFKRFEKETNSNLLQEQFNLPHNTRALLFCGRMNAFKNPVFVVEILNELLKQDKTYHAIFVGEGDLTKDVTDKARAFAISDHVHLAGWRNDLADVMKACNVFVFPRVEYPKEGLGLVVVEAQAAGLPMFLSNGIVADAIEISELAHFIPLDTHPSVWAAAIQKTTETISAAEALERMQASKFSLPIATKNLLNLYE
jgi:glycosyltransferase involved in cell wall biosynthesis